MSQKTGRIIKRAVNIDSEKIKNNKIIKKEIVNDSESEDDNEEQNVDEFKNTLGELQKELDGYVAKSKIIIKKIQQIHNSNIKAAERIRKQKIDNKKPSGFFIGTESMPKKMADFIGVKAGTKMDGHKLNSAVWTALKNKKLISDEDGRLFKITKEINDVFKLPANYSKYKKDKMDPKTDIDKCFNMFNLQGHINKSLNSV